MLCFLAEEGVASLESNPLRLRVHLASVSYAWLEEVGDCTVSVDRCFRLRLRVRLCLRVRLRLRFESLDSRGHR